MPDADDEAEPEVLSARRRPREAPQPVSHRFEHGDSHTRTTSCAATSACCAHASPTRSSSTTRIGGVTLASRVPGLAGVVYPQPAREPARAGRAYRAARGGNRGDHSARTRRRRAVPRVSARPTSSPGWSGSSQSCRGVMGTYYAAARWRARGGRRRRSKRTTARASRATRCRTIAAGTCVALADKLDTLAGLFGHRPAADRRQGSRSGCAGRRSAWSGSWSRAACPLALADLVARGVRGVSERHAGRRRRLRCARSFSSGCAAISGMPATARTRSSRSLCMRPTRLDLVPRQLAAVRAFAAPARGREPRRGEQARGEYPASRPPGRARRSRTRRRTC